MPFTPSVESQSEAPVPVVSPGRNPDPSTVPRARTKSLVHSTARSPLRRLPPRTAVPLLSPPVSGDVGDGRGRGVPRVPRRGVAAPPVADAREAAPPRRRVLLGWGRVLGQHTRRIRGECFLSWTTGSSCWGDWEGTVSGGIDGSWVLFSDEGS
jgi:hypothetical protein